MSLDNSIKVLVQPRPWADSIDVLLRQGSAVGTELVFKVQKPGEAVRPTFSISMMDAQALIDELWRCGLRPTEGSGSAGSLAATERHLDDMRRLVFKANYQPQKR